MSATQMTDRPKPFVAWMDTEDLARRESVIALDRRPDIPRDGRSTPVVVTPLMPDDPRPGETWRRREEVVEIMGAPTGFGVPVRWQNKDGSTTRGMVSLSDLRPVPPLKTFRIPDPVGGALAQRAGAMTIQAESLDAALAKIREQLVEVDHTKESTS